MRLPLVVSTAVCAWLALPAPASACFCSSSCRSVLTAPVLFEATVVALDPDPSAGGGQRFVKLANVRAVRGDAPTMLEMGSSSCDVEFKVGVRYLIEAEEWAPGKFGASSCGLTRPAVRAAGFMAVLTAPSAPERPRVWGTVTTPVVDHRHFLNHGGGPPVAGAVVTLAGPVSLSTTTTSSGEFRFGAVPDGSYQLLVETPAARVDVTPPDPRPLRLGPTDSCASVDLVAPSTARVVGHVVDVQGRPAGGVQVELYTPPHNPFRRDFVQWPAVSDASGRFEFVAVAPGTYVSGVGVPRPDTYAAYSPAFARAPGGRREFVVAPGAVVELAPVVATRVVRTTVAGRVSGPDGVALDRLGVVAAPIDAEEAGGWRIGETNALGRFTGELYRGVRYRVFAVGDGRRTETVEVTAGDAPIVLTIRPR